MVTAQLSPTSTISAVEGINEVTVRGRVSSAPQARELPSGDTLVMVRVVVPRPPEPRRKNARPQPTQDTIDVACWSPGTRRTAARLAEGDVVTVRGSLRRRFWRSPGGLASRYEVAAATLTRDRRGALVASGTPDAHDSVEASPDPAADGRE